MKWKEITKALVTDGRATELYQELDRQTGYECPFVADAGQSAYQRREEPCFGRLLDKSKVSADGVEPDRATEELADTDEYTSASGLDESESDDDILYELVIPPDLIREATDVSRYKNANSPLTFEIAFAQERSLA